MTVRRARKLRCEQTDAEARLWMYLRKRRLRGYKFRRQHPLGRYIVDFACLERHVIVELDGGQHTDQQRYDTRRDAELKHLGFAVLRFWNDDVFVRTEEVLEEVLRWLEGLE